MKSSDVLDLFFSPGEVILAEYYLSREGEMRVTEKGQVTIPKTIRDRLGIGPGSEVDFVDKGTSVELVRADVGLDRDERLRWIAYHLDHMRGTLDTGGLDGKAYVDMLRGPREDLDPD